MSDPWRIELEDYHGATVAYVRRPYRTAFRKRLKYHFDSWHKTSGGDHRKRIVGVAARRIPVSVDYEVVPVSSGGENPDQGGE